MTSFTRARPHEAAYVVYMNGVEVPVQSVDVDMGAWKIPTAAITMAPDVQLQRLGAEDRVKVEIFYLDDVYSEVVGRQPEFCLLFEGDIVGWRYMNTPRGRQMSFTCVNQLRLLDDLMPYFITGLDTLAAKVFSDTNIQKVSSVHYAPALFVSLLHKGLVPTDEPIRRPYDFIENFIRAVVDPKAQKELGSVPSTNFFARQMKQLNFMNRFVPSPILETDVMAQDVDNGGVFPILAAMKKRAVIKAILNKSMTIGNGSSAWEMIQQLFSMMYYEVLPLTTAPIAQVDGFAKRTRGVILGPPKWKQDTIKEGTTAGAKAAQLGDVAGAVADMLYRAQVDNARPNRILNYISKPQWIFGVPPSCNVIFPSMIHEYHFEENYDAQPTRMYVNDERLRDMSPNQKLPPFATLRVGFPKIVQDELDKKSNPQKGSNGAVSGKNFLIWPEEFYRGPRVAREVLPEWFQYLEDSKKTSDAGDTEEDRVTWEQLREVQETYAEYEYHRNRAQMRSGQLRMLFNPYVVPGFPTTIFDGDRNGNHLMAYVLNVSHHMSVGERYTRINFTYGQTLVEAMEAIIAARSGETASGDKYPNISAAPAHPVSSLRDVLQHEEKAEEYFRSLFYQTKAYSSDEVKTAAFFFPGALELVLPSGEEKFAADVVDDLDTDTLDKFVGYAPSAPFAQMFENPDAAMRYVSRPVCTLEEFIDFIGDDGVRLGPVTVLDKQSKGAPYYKQIRNWTTDAASVSPTFDENNNLVSPAIATLPQSRVDWTTKLKNYRAKVMDALYPQES